MSRCLVQVAVYCVFTRAQGIKATPTISHNLKLLRVLSQHDRGLLLLNPQASRVEGARSPQVDRDHGFESNTLLTSITLLPDIS